MPEEGEEFEDTKGVIRIRISKKASTVTITPPMQSLLLNVMCLVEKYEDKLYSICCDPTRDRTRENINPYFN
jgi:hypothetical protein